MISTNTKQSHCFPLVLVAAVLLFALGQSNCTGGPLEGDWFQCEDDACTVLDDDGIRFTAGDRWGVLDAPGGAYDEGDPYELQQPRGHYDFDGQNLVLTIDGSTQRLEARLTFEGDVVVVRAQVMQEVCEPSLRNPGELAAPPTCRVQSREETVRFKRVSDAAGPVPYATTPEGRTEMPPPPQLPCGNAPTAAGCG